MDFQKEFELQGGQKKLTEYPLSLDSVVFDIGGYLGDWTAEIIQRGKIVCEHCGEATFSRETTERIRRMVHGAGRPIKTVEMDVFAMA